MATKLLKIRGRYRLDIYLLPCSFDFSYFNCQSEATASDSMRKKKRERAPPPRDAIHNWNTKIWTLPRHCRKWWRWPTSQSQFALAFSAVLKVLKTSKTLSSESFEEINLLTSQGVLKRAVTLPVHFVAHLPKPFVRDWNQKEQIRYSTLKLCF